MIKYLQVGYSQVSLPHVQTKMMTKKLNQKTDE